MGGGDRDGRKIKNRYLWEKIVGTGMGGKGKERKREDEQYADVVGCVW